jgi:hypothetical protein
LATIVVALLPKCPACWSVYAGLSSVLGLSFVVEARYLLPVTLLLSGVFVYGLIRDARRGDEARRTAHARASVAAVMAAGVLTAKFGIESPGLMYTCLLGLAVSASPRLWRACARLLSQRGVRRERVTPGAHVRTAP